MSCFGYKSIMCPVGFLTKRTCQDIESYFGIYENSDRNNFSGGYCFYMQICVLECNSTPNTCLVYTYPKMTFLRVYLYS